MSVAACTPTSTLCTQPNMYAFYSRYVGKINRLEAEQCLEGLRDGTYMVRKTEGKTPEYTHAIAVRLVLDGFLCRHIS